ncbi:SH3 domain-containing protein [Pelagivirga sediminicola]|nr:SH3 domain-containing protein [Pelagivirga sediminicola]
MWRFILISFGFLGFAFYEASGGADYAPSPNSLQIAMQDRSFFAPAPKLAPKPQADVQIAEAPVDSAPAAPEPAKTEQVDMEDETVTRAQSAFAGLSDLNDNAHGGFEITLASAARPLNGGNAMGQRPLDNIGTFSAETLVRDVNSLPIEAAVIARQQPADIRSIAGTAANMRSGPGTDYEKVDQLAMGTRVEVLDRRGAWMELRDLQTGQTGWMADWLVTSMN